MKLIRLDIKNIKTGLMIRFMVDCITVIGDTLMFVQKDLTRRYHLENYTFTINGNEYFS